MEISIEQSGMYAVLHEQGDYLYITPSHITAEVAQMDGHDIVTIPFFGDPHCTAAKALYHGDVLVGAVNEELPTLRFAIRVGADGTGFIAVK